MLRVSWIVLVRHQPLIAAKDASRLEHPEGLAVDALEGRGVDRGLDRVAGVKGGILDGHVHKVTLNKFTPVLQACGDGVAAGAVDLVVVVVEASDVGAREVANLARGAANATANVEDLEMRLDGHVGGKEVLMPGDGLLEGLAWVEAAEVEGGSPGVLKS